jgi:hypothetical protein
VRKPIPLISNKPLEASTTVNESSVKIEDHGLNIRSHLFYKALIWASECLSSVVTDDFLAAPIRDNCAAPNLPPPEQIRWCRGPAKSASRFRDNASGARLFALALPPAVTVA